MNPKVSVIIPIYNVEKYIEKCLNAVINQTLKEVEIIIIDDGSTDTSGIISGKISQIDTRIILVKNTNCGVSKSRNQGLELARGEYVVFLDSDDYIEEDMLRKMYLVAEKLSCEVIQCNYAIDNNGKYKKVYQNIVENKLLKKDEIVKYLKQQLITGSLTTYVWDKMYKRDFLQKNNLIFREELDMFEDWYFIMDLVTCLKRFAFISDNLYYYRVVRNSLCRKYISNYEDLLINLQCEKLKYMDKWNLNNSLYKYKYIISLYEDIIKLIYYILDKNHKLNTKTQLLKFNTIIQSNLIEENFNKQNDNIYIENTSINRLYLKPILYGIRSKNANIIYLWIKIYRILKKG